MIKVSKNMWVRESDIKSIEVFEEVLVFNLYDGLQYKYPFISEDSAMRYASVVADKIN